MKYLLWIGVILIVLWFIRTSAHRRQRTERPPAAREPEKMVRCAQCGVHMPESESIRDDGAHYCSAEHRRAARAMKN